MNYRIVRLNMLMLMLHVFLIGISTPLLSQHDSLQSKSQDSLLQNIHDEGLLLIEASDSALKKDSVAQAELLDKIESLRKKDKSKKEKLQKQYDSLQLVMKTRNEKIKHQVDSIRANTPGIPVLLNKDTLLYVYSKLGPFSPSERAHSIERKLKQIADGFDPKALSVIHGEETSDLFYNEIIVLSITDRDAFWMDKKRDLVILDYKELIIKGIEKYNSDTSWLKTLGRVGLVLLVLLILVFMVRYLNKFMSKVVKYVGLKGKKYLKGIHFKNYEILTYERELQVVFFLLDVIKWMLIVFIVYAALPLIFSVFPTTEGIANRLLGYILDPLVLIFKAFVGYIPEMITIAVIVVLTRYFVKFLRYLSSEIEHGHLVIPGFYPDWAKPTFNLVSFIVHVFAFIVIFPYLPGSDSPIFQGVSVFLGLLISLGSSSAISNLVAGLVITYMRPFKIGERVKIGDVVGDVIEKTMLVTRIRTIKNEDVTIPNGAVLSGQTTNYSSSAMELGLILNTSITIGYDVHWKKVRDCLIEAAERTNLVNKEPKPFVLQTSLDDFYVSYQINAYTNRPDVAAKIYSELHSNILDVFHNAGIEIMSPHFRAERDGSTVQTATENDI